MRSHRAGWSLVELLIVIAIIALLLQLVIPAVEMSRESARGVTCDNNLRQLGLASQIHVDTHGHFPAGGWGWRWAGDPDRGFGEKQPGGWAFNLLPYVEESELWNNGKGYSEKGKRAAGMQQSGVVVPIYICPSRRLARAYPNATETDYFNIDRADKFAKCDYAASAGDVGCCDDFINRAGPESLAEGDAAAIEPPLDADGYEAKLGDGFYWSRMARESTGMIYLRSTVRPAQVTDGLSHTYLIGEKYLDAAQYRTGSDPGDDQSWNIGYDEDIYRWADWDKNLEPRQDVYGEVNIYRFGSSHPMAMNFVLADGSVQSIAYTIDAVLHAQMSNRMDGEVSQ